jgi:hypothetical protein
MDLEILNAARVWEEKTRTTVYHRLSPLELEQLALDFKKCVLMEPSGMFVQFSPTVRQSAKLAEDDLPRVLAVAFGEDSELADPSEWKIEDFGGRKTITIETAIFQARLTAMSKAMLAKRKTPSPMATSSGGKKKKPSPPPSPQPMVMDLMDDESKGEGEEEVVKKRFSTVRMGDDHLKYLIIQFHAACVVVDSSIEETINKDDLWRNFFYWLVYVTKSEEWPSQKSFHEMFEHCFPSLVITKGEKHKCYYAGFRITMKKSKHN